MQHVLIIGKVWPEPNSSAAGTRTLDLVEIFQTNGYKVSVASTATKTEFSFDLETIGVDTYPIVLNSSSFDVFIRDLNPDLVIFDRFITEEQFGWRVAEFCPKALRVLDTIDLHSLRRARQEAVKQNKEFELMTLQDHESALRELASLYRCDLSLMISEAEITILESVFQFPPYLLHYMPFLLEPLSENTIQAWPTYAERSGFVSIGNFLHEPNWDSVLWIKMVIWPLIRKQLPGARIDIYGAYPSQKVFDLHKPTEGFYVHGRADSAQSVMQSARVCLAPLRFGAGLKGKLLDALCNGTPSVTTSVGAEGMHGDLPWAGLLADSPEKIAEAAVRLYSDEILWTESVAKGVQIINEVFPKTRHANELITRIRSIQAALPQHRQKNMVGKILKHQSFTASKYMALYIEAKNKAQGN